MRACELRQCEGAWDVARARASCGDAGAHRTWHARVRVAAVRGRMGRGTRACGRMGFCKAQARRVRLPAWLAAWLAAWLVARLAACLAGWLAGWLAAWPAAWLAAWLAARLAAWPGGTGWLPGPAGMAGWSGRRVA